MPTQADIDAKRTELNALIQQKANEDGAPISKKYVDDVIAGSVSINNEPPKALTNIAAKGITIEEDVTDGQWVTVVLPTDKATVDDKVLLKAFCATLQAKGAQVVSLGEPIKIRWARGRLAHALTEFEGFFK